MSTKPKTETAPRGSVQRPGSARWKWVCEACYRTSNATILPTGWELVWQSAICPKCAREATITKIGFANLRGGQYAGRRRDPRAKSPNAELSDDRCH